MSEDAEDEEMSDNDRDAQDGEMGGDGRDASYVWVTRCYRRGSSVTQNECHLSAGVSVA